MTHWSYQSNRYSVPFGYVGHHVHVQDEKNGILHIFNQEGTPITKHEKANVVHQVITNKKHFEGIRTAGSKTVPQPMPKLVATVSLEVVERSLAVYEALTDEEVIKQ
ncbi:Mu transposase domain-containing protein [Paenibacillus macquariensis]|uniref:Transposase for insertion sequence element IS21-like C-terminal domain-containing protein n=1 Tax=Paenibacillus macquariensis TaxID=948756 RepID=A0ABY1K2R1_9BACL|nr:hypothetical protein [Paenibacillus macquariensis]MEC0090223.1 hypothetical protein [Paenibacillus macquariensis]SIR17663.1 hypothetical protein SAMN05421578_10849 [Paenibacillus macquariensis]